MLRKAEETTASGNIAQGEGGEGREWFARNLIPNLAEDKKLDVALHVSAAECLE
jgi:hypothetical protein